MVSFFGAAVSSSVPDVSVVSSDLWSRSNAAVSAKDALSADGSSESGVSVRKARRPVLGVVPSSRPIRFMTAPTVSTMPEITATDAWARPRTTRTLKSVTANYRTVTSNISQLGVAHASGVGQVVAGVDHARRRVDEGAGHRNGGIDDRATRVLSGASKESAYFAMMYAPPCGVQSVLKTPKLYCVFGSPVRKSRVVYVQGPSGLSAPLTVGQKLSKSSMNSACMPRRGPFRCSSSVCRTC